MLPELNRPKNQAAIDDDSPVVVSNAPVGPPSARGRFSSFRFLENMGK